MASKAGERRYDAAAGTEGPRLASKSSTISPTLSGATGMRRADLAVVGTLAIVLGQWFTTPALADPCGMVPPIYVTDNTSLVRVGDEQTYVFFKEGLETFVIRPGFSGKVEDFGMLISFPTPPALRKVSEDIFPQIAAAID